VVGSVITTITNLLASLTAKGFQRKSVGIWQLNLHLLDSVADGLVFCDTLYRPVYWVVCHCQSGVSLTWVVGSVTLNTDKQWRILAKWFLNNNNNYTVSQKNIPPLACYNFDTHEWILIFFGRNVTDKVGNQKTLYYVTSNNLCFCTTWQNWETRKSHFLLGLCYTHNAPVCCLTERKSCHLWCVW